MTSIRHLVSARRDERRAARFLLAYAQSSLGTWAGATAIVVLAYQRFHSAWAVTLILLADFVPGMLLGPLLGAVADRWPRRRCLIAADVARAGAFAAIALISNFEATVALATIAGAATALFTPAALSSLPDLVEPERVQPLTAFYGVLNDVGKTIGPLLAGGMFALIGAGGVVLANGVSFAASAAILVATPFATSRPGGEGAEPESLFRDAWRGVAAAARMPVLRVVLWATALTAFFAAMMNVGEFFLARKLGGGATGYAAMITVFGCGMIAGSAYGARKADERALRSRYLAGILLVGAALVAIAAVPVFAFALAGFAVAGVANGLVIVHQRVLIQTLVSEAFKGRAFAALETLLAWGFVASYLVAGALVAAVGVAPLLAIAGGGCLAVRVAAGRGFARDARPVTAYAGAPISPELEETSSVRTASA
jgi:MFS family permease